MSCLDKGKQWKFDYVEWLETAIPTTTNPDVDRLPEFSPSFSVMNAQVTKFF
jgi:hypothetical protein